MAEPNVKLIEDSARLVNIHSASPSYVIAAAAKVSHNSTPGSYEENVDFVKKLMSWGHWSPFEFFAVQFVCRTTRDVTHELVRHRLASYMQESQRYCKYDECLEVIAPMSIREQPDFVFGNWLGSVKHAHKSYLELLEAGVKAEDARTVLPGCTATTILVRMNLREFRHFLDLRTAPAAWIEMRSLASEMGRQFCIQYPDDDYLVEDVIHGYAA